MTQLNRRYFLVGSGISLLGLTAAETVFSLQSPKRTRLEPARKLNTTIVIELLTAEGVGINAREWSELFQELDVQLTVRKSLGKEQPETTEKLLGTSLRDIHLIGRLDRDGSITFADRRYTTSDAAKIREWIADMKMYGAQGTPKGQPMWGLTKGQFEPVFLAFSPPIKAELTDLTFEAALQNFTVQKQFPFRFTATAIEHLKQADAGKTVHNQYSGLSEGAVLAAMLNEFGLGFHPRRTPDGKLELGIVKLGERIETWPAGWPPSEELVKLRPIFFKPREVELTDEPLLEVVQTIGDLIKVAILIDETGLKAHRIDVRTKKVSHKKQKVILSAALKHICHLGKCKYEFRMDEAGNPLLWLTADVAPKEDD